MTLQAEVDALIELVSKLKNEKEVYKVQVKRLVQLMSTPKVKSGNGISVVGNSGPRGIPPKELSVPLVMDGGVPYKSNVNPHAAGSSGSSGVHISEQPTPSTPGDDMDLARAMYKLISGNRCSRSSTVTTFVPSSPDDVASRSDLREVLEEQGASDRTNNTNTLSPTSPNENSNGQLYGQGVLSPTNGIRISQSALATLKESIQALHWNQPDRPTPQMGEEFPKLMPCVPPDIAISNNNGTVPGEPLVPSVYNGTEESNGLQGRELVDLRPGVDSEQLPNSRPKDKDRRKKTEKLNFIVYI